MYGPPGTGKTLLARACAAQTDATFLKLAGPQLVQMFIGDGAKLVRDCFALAKEKAPSIIFIDELDAVGTKRFDSEKSGDREVQRTMLELLNQLDGFASDDRVKVLAATNRVDVLDPALLRSGRLDRKIEFPLPNEEARAQILRIHSRKMTVDEGVNWQELARSTDEFGGAQLKAVCVEAGMIALRSGQHKISHEHFVDAIAEVQVCHSNALRLLAFYANSAPGQEEGHSQLLRIKRMLQWWAALGMVIAYPLCYFECVRSNRASAWPANLMIWRRQDSFAFNVKNFLGYGRWVRFTGANHQFRRLSHTPL
jgi:SpoVK/Ycf46/Vps4 family AAA+-type ATPase